MFAASISSAGDATTTIDPLTTQVSGLDQPSSSQEINFDRAHPGDVMGRNTGSCRFERSTPAETGLIAASKSELPR